MQSVEKTNRFERQRIRPLANVAPKPADEKQRRLQSALETAKAQLSGADLGDFEEFLLGKKSKTSRLASLSVVQPPRNAQNGTAKAISVPKTTPTPSGAVTRRQRRSHAVPGRVHRRVCALAYPKPRLPPFAVGAVRPGEWQSFYGGLTFSVAATLGYPPFGVACFAVWYWYWRKRHSQPAF